MERSFHGTAEVAETLRITLVVRVEYVVSIT
jgi:hypothetical protein